jgi:chromate transporter
MTERPQVGLLTVARAWGRIGVTGFGGPPSHIALLRGLCVEREGWLSPTEFEDAIAGANLLPGPASTQLAIYTAWRVAGVGGAVVGGLAFICPGLVAIIALAAFLLRGHPPHGVLGAASGAAAAVPAVALAAAWRLTPSSWERAARWTGARARWVAYAAIGCCSVVVAGSYLVLAIAACGIVELELRHWRRSGAAPAAALAAHAAVGGLAALSWVALKVGALSFGGGFVIVPLMQHDAVTVFHWMTAQQFSYAVALGQLTPGPVVQTVAVVGYAAGGLKGALLAAAVAFAPSFVFVLAIGRRFDALRENDPAQRFLTGAGACAIGAIAGSAVILGTALTQWWQVGVVALALAWLFAKRGSIVWCLLGAAGFGAIAVLAGAPLGR